MNVVHDICTVCHDPKHFPACKSCSMCLPASLRIGWMLLYQVLALFTSVSTTMQSFGFPGLMMGKLQYVMEKASSIFHF